MTVSERIAKLRSLMDEANMLGNTLKQENSSLVSVALTELLSSAKMMQVYGQTEDISSRQKMKWQVPVYA